MLPRKPYLDQASCAHCNFEAGRPNFRAFVKVHSNFSDGKVYTHQESAAHTVVIAPLSCMDVMIILPDDVLLTSFHKLP